MARNGKIARLPLFIRNQLNQRLSEGESGVKLVEWLNDEAMLDLQKDAEGHRIPITEQNLSEWRSGGYQDWLRHEEARQFLKDMAEQAGELDTAADGKSICDRFGALLAVDMARLAKKFLQQETDDDKRWERLKEISKELSRLRRDEHRAVWTWIKREQWERRREREDYEEEETIRKEVRHEEIAPLLALRRVRNLGELYGGGPDGMETAAMVLEVQEDLEPGSLVDTVRSYNADQVKAAKVGAGQSIKPNPTKSNQKSGPDAPSGGAPKPKCSEHTNIPADSKATSTDKIAVPGTGALRLNPTKSNQNSNAEIMRQKVEPAKSPVDEADLRLRAFA